MPLLDHLKELRRRVIYSLVVFLLSFGLCYYFSAEIYKFLAEPLMQVLREQGVSDPHLISTDLTEGFFTYIRVGMFGALLLAFPFISIQLWMFIAPGLYKSEKQAFFPFLVATPILFILGGALAYYGVIPYAWRFFLSFQQGADTGVGIRLEAKISEYLSLVMKLIFAFGCCFELPVALTLMVRVGLVSVQQLVAWRRYAYVAAFGVAAVLAPPDALTMVGLAIPLMGLYEVSILTSRMILKKKKETEELEEKEEILS
ncbi:twin-arginine translocase subunit TatC [Acetobacteraceae bacterium]|nr:twin-arginine translocase subunit TatC [Acetobacteraceae bacterium]